MECEWSIVSVNHLTFQNNYILKCICCCYYSLFALMILLYLQFNSSYIFVFVDFINYYKYEIIVISVVFLL